MADMVHATINHQPVEVPKGTSILNAAKSLGVYIPTLCHHPDIRVKSYCRLCLVEVAGKNKLVASCATALTEGMEILTDTPQVREAQLEVLKMILERHELTCPSCPRVGTCDLQKVVAHFNLLKTYKADENQPKPQDWPINSNPSLVRDPSKCVRCARCVLVCKDMQSVEALTLANRSSNFIVSTAYNLPLEKTDCTLCGQCSVVCPTSAIVERDDREKVYNAINDPTKHVVVQISPAIRVSISEAFRLQPAEILTGQIVTVLKKIGFDRVFDTNFGADLTIMEEGHEFIHRLQNNGVLPMMTSCCPAWINFVEKQYSEIIPHISSAKSPMGMFGAVVKTYYAQKMHLDPKNIFNVAIMPCTAKKFEASRQEMGRNGYPDTDAVLTTREFIKMIRHLGVDIKKIPETPFDNPLGIGSGAGAIFGTSGGVMEAALRTVVEKLTGKELEKLDFVDVRGFNNLKETTLTIGDRQIKIAVVHTLAAARKMAELVKSGNCPYDFIEVMACPGGCVGGGGQPTGTTNIIRQKRMAALYNLDRKLPIRKSHDNPEIQTLYKEFMEAPLSEKAHDLLHTHYKKVNKLYEFQ